MQPLKASAVLNDPPHRMTVKGQVTESAIFKQRSYCQIAEHAPACLQFSYDDTIRLAFRK